MLQNETLVKIPAAFSGEDKLPNNSIMVKLDCNDKELKQELRIAAGHCQLLAEKLCRNELQATRKAEAIAAPEVFSFPESECCREQKLKNTAIVAENIKLRQDFKNATEVNKRWQKYNAQQQEYIQRLQTTIEILQTGVGVPATETSHVPFRQEEDRNRVTPEEVTRSHLSLKTNYENALTEISRLEKEVEKLRTKLENRERDHEAALSLKGIWEEEVERNVELAEVFKLQAHSFSEEWKVERDEKNAALERLSNAQAEVTKLSNKCEKYASQLQRIHEDSRPKLDFKAKNGSSFWSEDTDTPVKRVSKASNCTQVKTSSISVNWPQRDKSSELSLDEEENGSENENSKVPTRMSSGRSQMLAHSFASVVQPRVLSRGSSRRQNIVCGDVEVDFGRTRSLPLQRTLTFFDCPVSNNVSKNAVGESANHLVSSQKSEEQYVADQLVLLSENNGNYDMQRGQTNFSL